MNKLEFKELFYEFLGVFSLCYYGGWAVILFCSNKLDIIGVSLVHCLVLIGFIICSASDSHFNPSVTLTFYFLKSINLKKTSLYILFQFLGSLVAGVALKYSVPEILLMVARRNGAWLGSPHFDEKKNNMIVGIIFEFLSTFLLVISILYNLYVKKYSISIIGITVGSIVGFSIFTFGSITGGSLNIFRYLGPSIISFKLTDFYMYTIPAIFSSIAAKYFFLYVFKNNVDSEIEDDNKKFDENKKIEDNTKFDNNKKLEDSNKNIEDNNKIIDN